MHNSPENMVLIENIFMRVISKRQIKAITEEFPSLESKKKWAQILVKMHLNLF